MWPCLQGVSPGIIDMKLWLIVPSLFSHLCRHRPLLGHLSSRHSVQVTAEDKEETGPDGSTGDWLHVSVLNKLMDYPCPNC